MRRKIFCDGVGFGKDALFTIWRWIIPRRVWYNINHTENAGADAHHRPVNLAVATMCRGRTMSALTLSTQEGRAASILIKECSNGPPQENTKPLTFSVFITREESVKYKDFDCQRKHIAYKAENISPNYYHSCCACHLTNFCLLSR